jgi:hypothetical protein
MTVCVEVQNDFLARVMSCLRSLLGSCAQSFLLLGSGTVSILLGLCVQSFSAVKYWQCLSVCTCVCARPLCSSTVCLFHARFVQCPSLGAHLFPGLQCSRVHGAPGFVQTYCVTQQDSCTSLGYLRCVCTSGPGLGLSFCLRGRHCGLLMMRGAVFGGRVDLFQVFSPCPRITPSFSFAVVSIQCISFLVV